MHHLIRNAAASAVVLLLAACSGYVPPAPIIMAQYQSDEVSITLRCDLVRPLTGSFWGIRGDYKVQFLYELSVNAVTMHGHYSKPITTSTRDVAAVRPLCQGQQTQIVPLGGDATRFAILSNGRHLATLRTDGTLSPAASVAPIQ